MGVSSKRKDGEILISMTAMTVVDRVVFYDSSTTPTRQTRKLKLKINHTCFLGILTRKCRFSRCFRSHMDH